MSNKSKVKILCFLPQSVHVNEHERDPHWVNGFFKRNGTWVPGFHRSGSTVSEHCRRPPRRRRKRAA